MLQAPSGILCLSGDARTEARPPAKRQSSRPADASRGASPARREPQDGSSSRGFRVRLLSESLRSEGLAKERTEDLRRELTMPSLMVGGPLRCVGCPEFPLSLRPRGSWAMKRSRVPCAFAAATRLGVTARGRRTPCREYSSRSRVFGKREDTRSRNVLQSPVHDRAHHRGQIFSLWSEGVFRSGRVLAVEVGRDDAFLFEPLEPVGQDVGGDSLRGGRELHEPSLPSGEVTDYEQRPPVPHDVEGVGDGARGPAPCGPLGSAGRVAAFRGSDHREVTENHQVLK